ncbi:MAG TPA: hypothetical protein VMT30_06610 [Candidatus Saccharimonadia bacterium]|nr:hypothetical protein [Candidatus Saccharimonadia bacterium]
MNTTTTPEAPTKSADRPALPPHQPHSEQFYTELIRIIAGLFVGLIALMTFLLTVGFQHPHSGFSWALYASIITLALNLVAYVAGHYFRTQCGLQRRAFDAAADEGQDLAARKRTWEQARKRLKVVRALQQVLFIAAVVAMTCLALATANFFFTIAPPAPSAAPVQ